MQEEITSELTSTTPCFEADQTPDSSTESSERTAIVGAVQNDAAEHVEQSDDEFEFTFEGIDRDSDWFPPGEIFPIFDRRLLSEQDAIAIENNQMQTVRSALKKLFIVDDDDQNPNGTDAELNKISPESYCVWTPGSSPQASPARCKKSSSTGTTTTGKRWGVSSLKELLIRRSRSDGKKSLVRFGSWKKKSEMTADKEFVVHDHVKNKNKEVAEGGGDQKRRTTTSYPPYKKAIIGFGFYPSVNGFNGMNRSRPPF